MTQDFTMNVPEGLEVQKLSKKLKREFEGKGYTVEVNEIGNVSAVTFEKGNETFKKFIGLNEKITANCSVRDDVLTVNCTDADFTSKFIAIGVGIVAPMIVSVILGVIMVVLNIVLNVIVPILGFFVAMIPGVLAMLVMVAGTALLVTACIGIYLQYALPKKINDAVTLIINSGLIDALDEEVEAEEAAPAVEAESEEESAEPTAEAKAEETAPDEEETEEIAPAAEEAVTEEEPSPAVEEEKTETAFKVAPGL